MPRNTSGLKRGAGPGRPTGSKNKIPSDFKASLRRVYEQLAESEPELYEEAIRAGLTAKPPASYQYLQLAGHWFDGKPTERVEVGGAEGGPITYQVINRMRSSSGGGAK